MEAREDVDVPVVEAVRLLHKRYLDDHRHPVLIQPDLQSALQKQNDLGVNDDNMDYNLALLSIGHNVFLPQEQSSRLLLWVESRSHKRIKEVIIQDVNIPGFSQVFRVADRNGKEWVYMSERQAQTDPMGHSSNDVELFELIPIPHFDPSTNKDIGMIVGTRRKATMFDTELIEGSGMFICGIVFHDSINRVNDPCCRFEANCCYWRLDVEHVISCSSEKEIKNVESFVFTLVKFLAVFSAMNDNTWTQTALSADNISSFMSDVPFNISELTRSYSDLIVNLNHTTCSVQSILPVVGSGERVVVMLRQNIELYYPSGKVLTRSYQQNPDSVVRLGFVVGSILIITHRFDKGQQKFRLLTSDERRARTSFQHGVFCAPVFRDVITVGNRFFANLIPTIDHPALLLECGGVFCSPLRVVMFPSTTFSVTAKLISPGRIAIIDKDSSIREWIVPLTRGYSGQMPEQIEFVITVVVQRGSQRPIYADATITRTSDVKSSSQLLLALLASGGNIQATLAVNNAKPLKRKRNGEQEVKHDAGDESDVVFSDTMLTLADALGNVLNVNGVQPNSRFIQLQANIDSGIIFRGGGRSNITSNLRTIALQ